MENLWFDTDLGICGVAWSGAGIAKFRLPGEGTQASEPAELPGEIGKLIESVRKHFCGEMQDFSAVRLDWPLVSEFQQSVYRETAAIRPGQTRSYGEISRALGLGNTGARAVGVALGSNPWPLIIPCHRVVAASGKMTGFSAPGGIQTKTRLLALEGAELPLGNSL